MIEQEPVTVELGTQVPRTSPAVARLYTQEGKFIGLGSFKFAAVEQDDHWAIVGECIIEAQRAGRVFNCQVVSFEKQKLSGTIKELFDMEPYSVRRGEMITLSISFKLNWDAASFFEDLTSE